jgi:hypothetical protein
VCWLICHHCNILEEITKAAMQKEKKRKEEIKKKLTLSLPAVKTQ